MGTYKSDLSPVAHADSWAVIPQSLHRGGLVMTTGGYPPPIELGINAINALKSCINRSVRRDKAKRIYEIYEEE